VIIRVFRPTIHPGKEPEFEAFLNDTAVPLVSRQAGLVAQLLIRKSPVRRQAAAPGAAEWSRVPAGRLVPVRRRVGG
jgi:hypothetical protein